MSPRIFMLAGEASGDALGAALLDGLSELAPTAVVEGVAGTQMQARGVESLFPMSDLSVMGLAEILPKYRHLHRRLHQTVAAVLEMRPDVLLTIDSPDFCLRVARLVRAADPSIRTVHYVAPSVWAWRPGRAVKMARMIDQVLALLPFEPPLMEAAGMRCDFVGHPVVAAQQATEAEAQALRVELGVGEAPLLLALPGSRRSEVTRLAPVFGAALGRVAQARRGARAVLPAAPGLASMVRDAVADWPLPVDVVAPENAARKRAAFRAADVALAASGTVSLELAAAGTPMVIGYRMNWLTMQIMRRMALVDTVTLVNLVSDTRVVPEFLGDACTADALAGGLEAVLDDPAPQRAACAVTMDRLGRGRESPGLRAARAVLDGLGR
ncbi:lipid-A-disaccharide synthase [Meridianimarinicoccus sp. RP-17]|uniref:lipid-A-disaccharide synthase n=1 Tax=Meridianimarinicoccus zhengii TaxID=2056810 RepID=UPI000DAEE993|nr:lipid-A-disaccharide synthase [Phycocomes zhengii]